MKTKYLLSVAASLVLSFSSCTGDLDVEPLDPNMVTAEVAYGTEGAYFQGLAKIYSVWAFSGQDGDGSTDIIGLDPGNCQLMRCWWNMNEVCTDEAKNSWGDTWVDAINYISWNTIQNEAIEGAYQRCMFIVALSNEYIKQVGGADIPEKNQYIAEARFCRALAYAVMLDLFRNPPFITDANFNLQPAPVGDSQARINPTLFHWIVDELKAAKADLPAARQGQYGRADQGAADFLLARLYLNAEVYAGENHYSDCIEACKNVIAGGYTLADSYRNLFMADNSTTSKSEIILPIIYDGAATTTWGGMKFLIKASISREEKEFQALQGIDDGWDGMRPTGQFVALFDFEDNNNPAPADIKDKRGIFDNTNRSQHITTTPIGTFQTEGWQVLKYSNKTSTGDVLDDHWTDTDFPLFRLADVYLMYAEAVLRGGAGGDAGTALQYINALRFRAYGNSQGKIEQKDLTLKFILDERARELYWEGVRRTDLIRFGLFTKGYNWDFKGGVATGSDVDEHFIIYPIPTTDISVNSNLVQNPGYDTSVAEEPAEEVK